VSTPHAIHSLIRYTSGKHCRQQASHRRTDRQAALDVSVSSEANRTRRSSSPIRPPCTYLSSRTKPPTAVQRNLGTDYRAFSIPGQFAPWSESANRTRANSLPGPFAPWPFRSLELLLPGPFAPEGQNHKMIKRHYKTPLTQYNRLSYRFYNRFDNRLYTRYSRLSNRLSYGFDNRLNVCTHDTTGCQASLTTDCIV